MDACSKQGDRVVNDDGHEPMTKTDWFIFGWCAGVFTFALVMFLVMFFRS